MKVTADGTVGLERMDALLTTAAQNALWKTADLLNSSVGPYQVHQPALSATRPDRQIVVLVHFESLPGFRNVWQVMRQRPNHPLHGDERLLLPLSVDEFEWMVEAARQTGRSLYGMLRAQARVTARSALNLGTWTAPDIQFRDRYLDGWWDRLSAFGKPAVADAPQE